MRHREAPSAPRTAISRRRPSALTSTRPATFTAAMSSSSAAPPVSVSRIGRTRPTMTSLSSTTTLAWPRFESGYNCSS